MKFPITSWFADKIPFRGMKPHSGTDIGMPEGTTLRSISNGTVKLADYGNQNAGKTVMIESPDGHTYIYGHCHDFVAKNGQYVHSGDIIAHSGNTGHSLGPHLHFGVKDTATGHIQNPGDLANKVADLAGDNIAPNMVAQLQTHSDHLGIAGKIIYHATDGLREHAKDMAIDITMGIFDALGDLLFGITLIGSAACIIMKVVGWKDGGRWAGMLMGANVLLRYVFGKGA